MFNLMNDLGFFFIYFFQMFSHFEFAAVTCTQKTANDIEGLLLRKKKKLWNVPQKNRRVLSLFGIIRASPKGSHVDKQG